MRSFLSRPGIFYTLCLGPSSLEPHLAGLFASFSAQLKHHLLREDLAHHRGPGPPPAPLTSTDHCLPHHLYFLYRIFLNLETLFSLVWVAFEQMVQCNGHEAKNLFFFPSRSLRSGTNRRATIFYFSKCWMRGRREKEASKPSCRTKTKRKRHE